MQIFDFSALAIEILKSIIITIILALLEIQKVSAFPESLRNILLFSENKKQKIILN